MSHQRAYGFGLVELMIALVLGLVLIAGAGQVFLSTKGVYRLEQGLSRLQENARYAMDTMTRDLRMAGYYGCAGRVQNLLNESGPNYDEALFSTDQPVGGWEYNGSSPGTTLSLSSFGLTGNPSSDWSGQGASGLPVAFRQATGNGALVVPGSDVVVLKHAEAVMGLRLDDNNHANSNQLNIEGSAASGIPQNTILLVTDCEAADLFQNRNNENANTLSRGASNQNPGPGNKNPGAYDWSKAWKGAAELYAFAIDAYYVGLGSDGKPALYRLTFAGPNGALGASEEVVEGVETLQLLYGEDTDGDGATNRWRTASQVSDWEAVTAVRISLLMRSPNEVSDAVNTHAYALADGVVVDPPNDRRMRFVVTSTVKLRNRGV
jgi:type IV pilus assembly protein PilW